MALAYVNEKGETYYLHRGVTKTGKPKFYFSKKDSGELADKLPRGFEIYETPNGQVLLRKKTRPLISEQEIKLVKQGVAKLARLKYFKVEAKKNALLVHLPDQDPAEIVEIFSGVLIMSPVKAEELAAKRASYSPVLRFVLVNEEKRLFDADRWCWRGSIDGWIELDFNKPLDRLVKKFCPHLGKESFFELF